jgi:hypothetical protein
VGGRGHFRDLKTRKHENIHGGGGVMANTGVDLTGLWQFVQK